MTTKEKIWNGLLVLVVLVVCPAQITIKRDSSEQEKAGMDKGKIEIATKVDSIDLLKGNRDSLLRENIKSLDRTDRKLDQIPRLVDKIISSQRRINNNIAVEYIELRSYPGGFTLPQVKPDSTVKKKRTEVNFLGFSDR